MTKTSTGHVRRAKQMRQHHYRPRRINIADLRTKPVAAPPRVIYVTSPFYEQMEYGEKTVEARPNYPWLRDIVPGTVVEFTNRSTQCSFHARISSRRHHHDFATMIQKETIKAWLPDPRAQITTQRICSVPWTRIMHSETIGNTYKFISRKHGVVSFRFTLCFAENKCPKQDTSEGCGEYDKNSLCSIFDYIKRVSFKNKYGGW